MDDLVSIILPIHNNHDYLDECLNSVYCQTYKNWELLIILNGKNCDLIKPIIVPSRFKKKVRILKTKVFGIINALNLGLSFSNGSIICRIDSDDFMFPKRIEAQLEIFKKYGYNFLVHSAYKIVDKNSREIELISRPKSGISTQFEKNKLFFTNSICHPTLIIKKDILENIGGFHGPLHCEDYDLWLRLIYSYNLDVFYISEPLIGYRQFACSPGRGHPLAYAGMISIFLRMLITNKHPLWILSIFLGFIKYFRSMIYFF